MTADPRAEAARLAADPLTLALARELLRQHMTRRGRGDWWGESAWQESTAVQLVWLTQADDALAALRALPDALAAAGLLVPDPVDDDALVEAVAKAIMDGDAADHDVYSWADEGANVEAVREDYRRTARHAVPALRARLAAGDDAQALARVLALHQPRTFAVNHPYCMNDGKRWPCPTVLAARSAATTDEEINHG